jgi:ribosome-associated protein
MIRINQQLAIPHHELSFSASRSGGPGGQNVNKVNTKATLRWAVVSSASLPEEVRARLVARLGRRLTTEGDLLVSSQRFRDAGRNVADCLEKLRGLLAEASRVPRPRKATRPTRGAIERRLQHKRQRSEKKRSRRAHPQD